MGREIPVLKEGTPGVSDIGEGHINVFPIRYSSITQGDWLFSIEQEEFTNSRMQNIDNADGDRINYKVFFAAGTYTFGIITITADDRGILDLLLDGVSKGTIDLYSEFDIGDFKGSITGIVIPADAYIEVGIKVSGKNGSSIGHRLTFNMLTFFRTA